MPKDVEGKGRFLTPSRAVPTFKLHRVLSSGTNFVLHVAEGCAEQNFWDRFFCVFCKRCPWCWLWNHKLDMIFGRRFYGNSTEGGEMQWLLLLLWGGGAQGVGHPCALVSLLLSPSQEVTQAGWRNPVAVWKSSRACFILQGRLNTWWECHVGTKLGWTVQE